MSKPPFSKKRGGKSVKTYPLGAKQKTGRSRSTKSSSRGRPRKARPYRLRTKKEQKRATLSGIDRIFSEGDYEEEELKKMGLVDLGIADWKDSSSGYDIYSGLNSLRSSKWEVYDLGYGSDTLWLVAVDKKRWKIVNPPEGSKVGTIRQARERCMDEWGDDIMVFLEEDDII